MRNWQGIRQDSDWTGDDGAFFLSNVNLDIEGELRRRPGLSAFSAQSGTCMLNFWNAANGYQIAFATATGELVVLETTP